MEMIIAIFLGGWLVGAGVIGYRQLKKDFSDKGKNKK